MASAVPFLLRASSEFGIIDAPTTREYMYQNNLLGAKIPDAFGFRAAHDPTEHSVIVDRCIDYFHRLNTSYDLQSLKTNDMWGQKISQHYHSFELALSQRNRQEVSDALQNMCSTGLVTGFTEGLLSAPTEGFEYSRVVENQQMLVWEAWHIFDVLFSFASALGHRIPCPEQGDQSLAYLDFESLLDYVTGHVTALRYPPRAGGGAFGINTVNGVIPIRDLFAAYNATRVTSILRGAGHQMSVCEIGGGIGSLAYYLAKMGVAVSVFDLPVVSILQSYFLMTSLSADQVWIFGEQPNPSAMLRIFPWWELAGVTDDEYSMAINIDSLPEIEFQVAQSYINLIHAKSRFWFFSVNQEAQASNTDATSQNVVPDLVQQRGGFTRSYRFPYWLRAGYVEELYQIAK